MTAIAQKRCSIHPHREAAVRCPSCTNYFCRECVTEHAGKLLCSRCLAESRQEGPKGSSILGKVRVVFQAILGFVVLWYVFYWFGDFLLSLPSSFHE
mgnify:CR=1 FL=1